MDAFAFVSLWLRIPGKNMMKNSNFQPSPLNRIDGQFGDC